MGKKRTRTSQTSKGERHSVARSTVKLVKRGRCPIEKAMNKIKAWRAGKNPWITVKGTESNKPFIKVRANSLYGDPRRTANIFAKGSDE